MQTGQSVGLTLHIRVLDFNKNELGSYPRPCSVYALSILELRCLIPMCSLKPLSRLTVNSFGIQGPAKGPRCYCMSHAIKIILFQVQTG